MSLRARLIINFGIILLTTVGPLSYFSYRLNTSLLNSWINKKVERALEVAVIESKSDADREVSLSALRQYGQLKALKEPIRREILTFSLVLSFFAFLLAVGISSLFVVRILKPLSSLSEATKRIGVGDLDVRVKKRGAKELRLLLDSFNNMAEKLKSSREELMRAERRAAWREVAQQIAHEIKNPLTPIRLATERLREKHKKSAPDLSFAIENATGSILTELETLERLLSEFSRFARLPSPVLKEVDITTILKEVENLYRDSIKAKFSVSIESQLPKVLCDAQQLKEVFVNLIDNSIHALPDEGGAIEISAETKGGEIEIDIKDNGSGINEEDKVNIFKPYFTKRKGGNGLGLAIVDRIISEHKGRIEVESKPGKGTTFRIFLPLANWKTNVTNGNE